MPRSVDDGGCGLGRHQRGRAAAEEDAGDRRPRQQRREVIELAQQRAPPPGLIHTLPDMAVEVAVGALGEAERPVDVEGERLSRSGRGRLGFAGHGRGGRKAASCSKARARWVSGCFSSGSISPKVRPWPSGDEDRVVAEAMRAARRKGESPVHAALDGLAVTVRPAERKRADEIGRRADGLLPACRKLRLDAVHRHAKVLPRPRPAGGIDAGRAVERGHHEAGIVGKCRLAARLRRRAGLEHRVRDEGVPGLLRLREAQRSTRPPPRCRGGRAAPRSRAPCRRYGSPRSGAPPRDDGPFPLACPGEGVSLQGEELLGA